jgi:hypothetical protein
MGGATHDTPCQGTTLLKGIFMTRNVAVLPLSLLAKAESRPRVSWCLSRHDSLI